MTVSRNSKWTKHVGPAILTIYLLLVNGTFTGDGAGKLDSTGMGCTTGYQLMISLNFNSSEAVTVS